VAGLKAFKEAYMSADTLDEEEFGDFDVRKLRYYIYWAFFENTVYRSKIHTWSTSYKLQHALYKYIRSLYNPAFRLGDFWQSHLMGGLLDPQAGDGQNEPSALPIVVPAENGSEAALRDAISQLWKWSNFQSRKDIFTLYGAVMGDVGLRVADDTGRKKVYLEVIHPGTIKDVTCDPFGHVKAYKIEEERKHPVLAGRTVTYTEIAERDGKNVVYQTLLDGEPYAWNGQAAEWAEPYGFVPIVLCRHNDVGLDWGWSELHPGRSKFHEVDDLSSALSDQIRKTVNVVWLFTGQSKPKTTPTLTGADSSTSRPEPGREEINALYASAPDADAKALVAPLNIADTTAYLSMLLERLEEDYPELRYEKLRLSNVSGESLREARKPVEEKVTQRRANYDDALKRAQQMAVAIGGHRKIFDGFSLESYDAGQLDHHIGKRPVFTSDPVSDLGADLLLWQAAEQAGKAGVPLSAFLRLQGWAEDKIDEVVQDEEYKQKQEMRNMALQGFGAMAMGKKEEEDESETGG